MELDTMKFESEFTTTYLHPTSCRRTYPGETPIPYSCQCLRCDRVITEDTNTMCSGQCAGASASYPQESGWFGANTWHHGEFCRHEHSRCMMPDCTRHCAYVEFFKSEIGEHPRGLIPQPFCSHHSPKCNCGVPRGTQAVFKYEKLTSGDDRDDARRLSIMYNSYEDKCVRCNKECPIPGCANQKSWVCKQRSEPSVYLEPFCVRLTYTCKEHAPECTECGTATGVMESKGEIKTDLTPLPASPAAQKVGNIRFPSSEKNVYMDRCTECYEKQLLDPKHHFAGATLLSVHKCSVDFCRKNRRLWYSVVRRQGRDGDIILPGWLLYSYCEEHQLSLAAARAAK